MEKATTVGDVLTEKEINKSYAYQNVDAENVSNSEEPILTEPKLRLFPLFRSLSPNIQKNVLYLRELQLQHIKLQVSCCKEIHSLMVKYANLCAPLLEKRRQIINGATQKQETEHAVKATNESDSCQNNISKTSGISEFWLTVFLNSSKLSILVEEEDEPILKYLEDVAVTYTYDSMDFVLEFHFKQNDYFTNTVLTKEYQMECEMKRQDPYGFEGPRVIGCKGCIIQWKDGKDVTHRSVKRKVNGKPTFRMIRKDSFFNFFDPPFVNSVDTETEEGLQEQLMDDFELGLYIKDRIVPRAILYYTMENQTDSECSETDYSTDSPESFDEDFRTHQSRPRNRQ